MNATLPDDLSVRPVRDSDLNGVFELATACDVHILGEPDCDKADLRDDWRDITLEHDTRVVEDASGAVVGYAAGVDRHATGVRPGGTVYVLPGSEGRGIGTWLTRWIEERARTKLHVAPEGARIVLEFGCSSDYAPALELLQNEGYEPERYFLRMTIGLDGGSLTKPTWPDGISVRTHIAGDDDAAVYEAVQESFSDHWGHTREPYEQWRKHTVEREGFFEPALWFLATSGGQIAGVAICSDWPSMDQGWVNTVGVRRPWRRSGVALALLHQAFAEFHRRGRKAVSLGVDAQSLTGATRVYEKAGMRVRHRFALCAKELRPGIEITTQELRV